MGVRPSFSTSAILVRLIPVLHFPVLRLGPFNSSPAFSVAPFQELGDSGQIFEEIYGSDSEMDLQAELRNVKIN